MSSTLPSTPPPGAEPAHRAPKRRRIFRPLLEAIASLAFALLGVLWWMNSTSNTGTLLTVGADHVSVVIGAFDDSVDVDDAPGMRALTPWLQDAYLVAKSPIEYAMTGNAWKNNNRVPRLAVRSADGSNFWFEDVRIQYAADPDRADEVLRDTGGDFAWHHGTMDAYARAVLRDAFGRYTAEEIVLQENQRDATARAKERLDEVLGMHGLYVIELSTSKPGFPKEYESVVQRRQIAEQEVQKIAQELAQLEASRADRLAKIERDKQRADTTMRSGLAFDLRDARRVALRTRAEADRAFESRVRAGTRLRDEKVSQADALTERYTKEAEGLRARADALRAHGPMAVRRALVDGLSKVQFEIAPHEAPPGAGVAAD